MENKTVSININIQDHTGDRKLTLKWNPNDEVAKKRIEETFLDLQKHGYRFFSCKKVLGLFKTKGKEVKRYDPSLGELIYEEPKEKVAVPESSLEIHEVEKPLKEKFEEPEKFDPQAESVDTSRDYVATKPMRAG